MEDTTGRNISFLYDEALNLVAVAGPESREERYIYDDEHNVTAILETGGRQVQIAYDVERDWATGLMLGEDLSNYSWSVPESGLITATVENGGVSTVHTFDDNEHRHIVEGPGGREETLLSSCCNKPLQVTADDGSVTSYEYDRQARLVSVTHPDGTRVRWAYHPTFSRILQAAYSDGRRYDYTYDDYGNLVEANSSEGIELLLIYGLNGKVERVTGSDSSEYTFRYDTSGRPVEIGAGEDGALRIAYGAAGEISGTEISQGAVGRAEFYRNLRRVLDLLEPATGR
jgi:YD repeat-containing protein